MNYEWNARKKTSTAFIKSVAERGNAFVRQLGEGSRKSK